VPAPPHPDLSPKDPQETTLHRIVREHLEDFLAVRERAGTPMARFAVDELRAFLKCGVLGYGAACFSCSHCGRGRMVALSCQGRGFCPRCLGRRMTELANAWTRFVLPHVRIRQWVLSLPIPIRVPLAFHHDLVLVILTVAARAIEGWYRAKGKTCGIADGRTGMVSVIQRFGGDLSANVHFHSLVLDGVCDDSGAFTPINAPTLDEMKTLTTTIATASRACASAARSTRIITTSSPSCAPSPARRDERARRNTRPRARTPITTPSPTGAASSRPAWTGSISSARRW